MDSLTANNPVVLSSLGGKPELPEVVLAEENGEGSDGEKERAESDETLGEVHERAIRAGDTGGSVRAMGGEM